jgi:hypothetical protein
MNNDIPVKLVLSGPIHVEIGSAAAGVLDHPVVGTRKAVGLRP